MLDLYKTIGESVRKERKRLGWTQEELSDRCGMHPAYIGQIERGVKKLSIASLQKIAHALHVSPGHLLDDAPAPPAEPWEYKISGLLRDHPEKQRRVLYSTLRHLANQMPRRKRKQ